MVPCVRVEYSVFEQASGVSSHSNCRISVYVFILWLQTWCVVICMSVKCGCLSWRKCNITYRGRTSGFKGNISAKYNFGQTRLYTSIFIILEFWHLGCPTGWLWKVCHSRSADQHCRRTILELCNLDPVIDCKGIHKYLGTVMVTWITQ